MHTCTMNDNFGLSSKEDRNPTSERPRYYGERIRIRSRATSTNIASGPVLRAPTRTGKHETASGPFRVRAMEGETKPSATIFSSSADEHEHAQPLKADDQHRGGGLRPRQHLRVVMDVMHISIYPRAHFSLDHPYYQLSDMPA